MCSTAMRCELKGNHWAGWFHLIYFVWIECKVCTHWYTPFLLRWCIFVNALAVHFSQWIQMHLSTLRTAPIIMANWYASSAFTHIARLAMKTRRRFKCIHIKIGLYPWHKFVREYDPPIRMDVPFPMRGAFGSLILRSKQTSSLHRRITRKHSHSMTASKAEFCMLKSATCCC